MSERVHLKDRYGNDLSFLNGGDVWVPILPDIVDNYRQHLKNLRRLEMRPDDVIVVGYPRSGNHWHNQIVRMLMEGTTEYTGFFGDDYVDGLPAEKMPPADKPRLLVSPADWYGDWFDHVLDWEAEAATNPNIFLSSFELLKQDPVGQITKMDQFLGLDRGPALCQQIAEACRFSKLKEAKDAQLPENRQHVFKKGGPGVYRKGEIGDWKNRFTVAQSEKFDELFNKRMSGSQLRFTFE